jgi:hypothetical protein
VGDAVSYLIPASRISRERASGPRYRAAVPMPAFSGRGSNEGDGKPFRSPEKFLGKNDR